MQTETAAHALTCLALDLGGTKLLLGEIDESGSILHSKRYPSSISANASQRQAMDSVMDAVCDYEKTVGFVHGSIAAMGMGMVGRVDNLSGMWLGIDPVRVDTVPVVQMLSERFGVTCTINNDVRCAVSAEQEFGWGRVSRNYVYINVGTGIAAGTVIDGNVVAGPSFHAGEIGHAVHSAIPVKCSCGRTGCVEAIASGSGMDRRARGLRASYPGTRLHFPEDERCSVREIFELADEGDALCALLADDAAEALAGTIMNLVSFSDPDTVVLGGGVVADGWLLPKIKARLIPKHVRFVSNGIVLTKIDADNIALIGAGVEGLNHYKKTNGRN